MDLSSIIQLIEEQGIVMAFLLLVMGIVVFLYRELRQERTRHQEELKEIRAQVTVVSQQAIEGNLRVADAVEDSTEVSRESLKARAQDREVSKMQTKAIEKMLEAFQVVLINSTK